MDYLVLFGVLAITFNILDSVSTHYCLKLPKEIGGKEGNPIMASLMNGDKLIAEIVKHLGLTMMVFWYFYIQDVEKLIWISLVFGIIVLNNTYIYATRKIFKKKIAAPFYGLQKLFKYFKIPEWIQYIIVVGTVIGVAKWLSIIILEVI